METLKKLVFIHCEEFVKNRILFFEEAIANAQSSANEEGKSSAGDKYETGRAMMQLEIEKNTTHLAEAYGLKETIYKLERCISKDYTDFGNLIHTSNGFYYIAISIGPVQIDGQNIYVVSTNSPIGKALVGRKKNDVVEFNKQKITIHTFC